MSNARNLANLLGTNTLVPSNKMFSGFANGITEMDVWYLTSNQTISSATTAVISGWSRWATDWEKNGTGMTESSGVFTFPSTGKWRIYAKLYLISGGTAYYHGILGEVSTDSGANFTYRSLSYQGATANEYVDSSNFLFVDVTDTSTFRVRFQYQTHSSSPQLGGASANLRNHVVFEKISDT
tara:strand:- start:237 stop:782 length:546 start_codon:yes stop_codon:yes gene_type:complete